MKLIMEEVDQDTAPGMVYSSQLSQDQRGAAEMDVEEFALQTDTAWADRWGIDENKESSNDAIPENVPYDAKADEASQGKKAIDTDAEKAEQMAGSRFNRLQCSWRCFMTS